MKKLRSLLLLLLPVLTACNDEPGRVRLEFIFGSDVPPLASTVYVFARVEERDTARFLGGVGPVSLAPSQATLAVDPIRVENGDDRIAVVEIREGPSTGTQILLYGISAPFSIEPGKVTDVPIRVGFRTPPVAGDVSLAGSVTGTTAFVAAPEVTLIIETDSGVRAQISNFVDVPEMPCGSEPAPCSETVQLSGGETAVGRPGFTRFAVPWDVNRGLADPCLDEDYCPRQVFVRLSDRQGYASAIRTVSLVLDTRVPGVVPGSFSVILRPPSGSPLLAVDRATAGTAARVSFTLTEPVAGRPSVMIGEVAPACIGTALTFDCELVHAGGAGAVGVVIEAVDRAGNRGRVELPGFEGDADAPSPPGTDPGAILYRRAPWGTPETAVSRFTLEGAPDAVEAGATVIAYNRREIAIDPRGQPAGEIGRTVAAADGSFGPFELIRADRSDVYLLIADSAGNLSDADPNEPGIQATEVRDAEWAATLSQRGAPNPNRAILVPRLAATLEPDLAISAAASPGELDALSGSGAPIEIPWAAQWQERRITTDTPAGRENFAMAYDRRRGRVVLFGGAGSLSPQLDDTWEWDGFAWRDVVAPGAPRPPGRSRHALAYDPIRGGVLLFGGFGPLGDLEFDDTWSFDGRTWRQLFPATSPPPRRSHAMAWDAARGQVVMFGGTFLQQTGFLDDTWLFDGTDWVEAQPADRPSPRSGAMMAYDSLRERVVLFGGFRLDGATSGVQLDDTWEWDGTNWVQRIPDVTPPPRLSGAMTFSSARGEIVLHGGRDCSPDPPNACGPITFYDDAWSWDGIRWAPIALSGDVPPAVDDHAMIDDAARGQLLIFGGGSTVTFDATFLEVAAGTWRDVTPTGARPTARFFAGAAFDESERRVTVVGGTDDGDLLGIFNFETWTWDGWNWRLVESPASGAEVPSAIWDPIRRRLVQVGCTAGCFASGVGGPIEVYERSLGMPWTLTPSSNGEPPPRIFGAAAYDPVLSQMILAGGVDEFGIPLTDTWGWDGQGWSLLFGPIDPPDPAIGPTRFLHAMVTDLHRQRVLLFGGFDVDPIAAETLWEWDGSTAAWTPVVPASVDNPTGRFHQAMVYDTDRRRAIMFGGESDFGHLDEVWTYDGLNAYWQRIPFAGNVPSGRAGPAMVYDPDRRRTLVFGGFDGSFVLRDDTWELELDPEERPGTLLVFEFAQSGEAVAGIQSIRIDAVAGGAGFTGDGTLVSGAEIQLWDAWSGAWRSFGSNEAHRALPEALSALVEVGVVRFVDGAGRIHVRFLPKQGLGSGQEGGVLSLEGVSLKVRYRR